MELDNYGVEVEFWTRIVALVEGNPFGIDFLERGKCCDLLFDLLLRVVDDHGIVIFLHRWGHHSNLHMGRFRESLDGLFLFQRRVLLRGLNDAVHGHILDIGTYVVLCRAINQDLMVKLRWMGKWRYSRLSAGRRACKRKSRINRLDFLFLRKRPLIVWAIAKRSWSTLSVSLIVGDEL